MSSATHIGPIRIVQQTYTPEEIRRLGLEQWGREYWEENVDVLVERIHALRQGDRIDADTLRRWATHPDERVRLALLESDYIWIFTWTDYGEEIAALCVETDMRHRAQGEAWNPTLDTLASVPYRWWFVSSRAGFRERDPAIWIREKVAPWLKEHGISLEETKRILSSTSSPDLAETLLGIVASDLEFVRWVIERKPSALATLAARKDLGPDEKREIWSAVLAACAAEQSDIPVLDVIKHFRQRRTLPSDAFVQLLEIAESGSMASRSTTVEALASILASKLPTGGDTVDLLRRFYWLARQNRKHVRAIVLHPDANEVLCAEIAADTKFNAIHVEIAKRFGGSPLIRKILESKGSRTLLELLARKADGKDLVRILDRLAETAPLDALNELAGRYVERAINIDGYRAGMARYFERLIEHNTVVALRELPRISQWLGEREPRPEWARAIARRVSKMLPASLDELGPTCLKVLEPDDWKDALQAKKDHARIVSVLLQIPSAVAHPEARRFIFEHGDKEQIVKLLEAGPLMPGESRLAALAVLRKAKSDFDEIFGRWPELGAGLETADLVPLLRSRSGRIRQKAILLVGALKKPAPEHGAQREEQGRRQAHGAALE